MVYQNAKLEGMPKFLRNRQSCRKKIKKMKLCKCTFETNASTFDVTKQNKEYARRSLTETIHDSSSNDKNCDWFKQVNAEEKRFGKQ